VISSSFGRPRGWLRSVLAVAAIFLAWGLAACSSDVPIEQKYPKERLPGDSKPRYEDPQNTIFGPGGLFGGGDAGKNNNQGGGGIGVNSLLWRASLDTLSFMPLVSADPFGGVIITDWYSPPASPTERFKVTVYILGRELRADGIRASVFHQTNPGSGWADAPVAPNTATDLENAILTRARQMRVAGVLP
jgi:hypothetical protein